MKWLVAALTGLAVAAFGTKKAMAEPEAQKIVGVSVNNTPFEMLFRKYGDQYKVPWQLLSGIAFVESSYRPEAVNYADNESIGLMQILCRPDGRGGCVNKFNISGWEGIKKSDLFFTEKNIDLAAQILAWNISNYGVRKGIAVYNAFDQRTAPAKGPFKNQTYVNRVMNRAKELGYEEV